MRFGPFKIHWGEVLYRSEIRVITGTNYYQDHDTVTYHSNPIRRMYGISYLGSWYIGLVTCGKQIRHFEKFPKHIRINQSLTDASQD